MNNLHTLKLMPKYFDMIENGTKTFEGRLYDEKRKLFIIGDEIKFIKEPEHKKSVSAKIKNIFLFKDFEEMADEIDKAKLGFANSSNEEMISTYYSIYEREKVEKYGVAIFEIELLHE